MKKLFIVLMLLFMVGCEKEDEVTTPETPTEEVVVEQPVVEEEEEDPVVEEEDPVEEEEEPEVVLPAERIYLKAFVPIVDLSDDYNLTSSGLGLYVDQEDLGITYVNIEEFLVALQGAVIPLEVEKTDTLLIKHTIEFDDEEAEKRGMPSFSYEMTIDADENTIYFNDVDMLDILDEETETDYSQGLTTTYSDVSDVDFSKLFDLDNYNMNIEVFEGEYYIPLYLANFFLTGFSVDIYELDTEVILVDYYTYDNNEEFFEMIKNREAQPLELVIDDTYNYLALYFDTMYGLKEYREMDDIYAELAEYPDLSDPSNKRRFYYAMNAFINDLDDLHSTFRYAGHRMVTYAPTDNYYVEDSRLRSYIEQYYAYECNYSTEDVELDIADGIAFVKVNGFSLDFPEQFKPIMREAAKYENIVFDLSCNGGGLISSAIHMLTYMSDETVYLYETDPLTGALYTSGYQSEKSNYIPANYYVFTSQVTYSAANMFASAVKDNDLGLIIGDRSLGGACAVQLTITPDGAIFNNSSNYAFANSKGEIIEDGVEPDYWLTEKFHGMTWNQSVAKVIIQDING